MARPPDGSSARRRSRGAIVDSAAQIKETYGDRMTFIHQEVYVDNDPNKGLRPPLRAFDLALAAPTPTHKAVSATAR